MEATRDGGASIGGDAVGANGGVTGRVEIHGGGDTVHSTAAVVASRDEEAAAAQRPSDGQSSSPSHRGALAVRQRESDGGARDVHESLHLLLGRRRTVLVG